MARAVLIVSRHDAARHAFEADLEALDRRLRPDNIDGRPLIVSHEAGATAAVLNPTRSTRLHGASMCLGALIGAGADWEIPGGPLPDGNYALFRCDAHTVELAADAAASRTIWYARTADLFVASTSQRAIVALLGRFELNPRVIPWMLSSGTLGPERGWAANVERVRPMERVVLDRKTWAVSSTHVRVHFRPARGLGRRALRERLETAVEDVCSRIDVEPSGWLLPLSGGVDSRGLLTFLVDRGPLQTVTWGRSAVRNEIGNDARIARDVAERLGVPNRYFSTDPSDEPRQRLVQRFVEVGEGRVAKISGYIDGFRLWKTIHEEGWDGIIRGDHVFGTMHVRSDYEARYAASLTLLSDYFQPEEVAAFELSPQRVPDDLARRSGETLATWRDRVYQEFRVPVLLAGLTDLKAPYVEVANPLLARSMLTFARKIPDRLRTRKRLWRELVRVRSGELGFAHEAAVQQLGDFLRDVTMLEMMLAEMESKESMELFGRAFRDRVRADLAAALRGSVTESRARGVRARAAAALPPGIRVQARRWVETKPVLHPLVLAFRAFVVIRTTSLLAADSMVLPTKLRNAANG